MNYLMLIFFLFLIIMMKRIVFMPGPGSWVIIYEIGFDISKCFICIVLC